MTLALLHEGGWDEVVMVAIGLVVAWGIIVFTRRGDEDAGDEPTDEPTEGGDA